MVAGNFFICFNMRTRGLNTEILVIQFLMPCQTEAIMGVFSNYSNEVGTFVVVISSQSPYPSTLK